METTNIASNFVGALAHLLTGSPGRFMEFIQKTEVIIGQGPFDLLEMSQFLSQPGRDPDPVILVQS